MLELQIKTKMYAKKRIILSNDCAKTPLGRAHHKKLPRICAEEAVPYMADIDALGHVPPAETGTLLRAPVKSVQPAASFGELIRGGIRFHRFADHALHFVRLYAQGNGKLAVQKLPGALEEFSSTWL